MRTHDQGQLCLLWVPLQWKPTTVESFKPRGLGGWLSFTESAFQARANCGVTVGGACLLLEDSNPNFSIILLLAVVSRALVGFL